MKLRPMVMADADKMLEWKNYLETRNYSISSKDEILPEDHRRWLQQNLDQFQIIEDIQMGLCGAIRIHKNEISIWIDRNCRERGIAKFFLNQVSKDGMYAKIVDGNVPSMRIFIDAGYKPVGHFADHYIFSK